MIVVTISTCPDCGGDRTIHKGVCFRCGYRVPRAPGSPTPAQVPAPSPSTPAPFPVPPQSGSGYLPVPASPVPAQSSPPGSASVGLVGEITSLGTPRSEIVELSWGDTLARIVAQLASLVALILGAIIFFPIVVVLVLVMLLVPAARFLLPSPLMLLLARRGGGGEQPRRREIEVPVTPFTITTPEGRHVEVILRGELQGGSPHLGDPVEVHGRVTRNGAVQAKTVLNRATGTATTTREHPAIARSRAKAIASLFAIAFLGFVLFSLIQYLTHLV